MREGRSRSLTAAALAAGWALLLWSAWPRVFGKSLLERLFWMLGDALGAVLGKVGGDFGWALYMRMAVLVALALGVAPAAAALVLGARMLARAQLRATGTDPLVPVRAWAARRPRALAALLAAPGALLAALSFLRHWPHADVPDVLAAALSALLAMGTSAVFGRGLFGLLQAPLDAGAAEAEEGADGFAFAAVAVTRETRAAVGALGVVSLGVAALLVTMSPTALQSDANLAGLAAYVAALAAAAAAFRGASRIALGLDGVLVMGSSRRRFFGYHDLDGVAVTPAGDLVLQRGGRAALRLQLHGKDAGRRAAIVARLEAGIQRARAPGAAHRLAEAATAEQLAHAARGETGYRRASATREELWEVLEAPAADAAARTRAAAALAVGSGGEDRARLRVAAEHCAEPATRAALLRIVEAEGEAEAEAAREAEAVEARGMAAPRAAGR